MKDQSGWRGPAELIKLKDDSGIVDWTGQPLLISLRHVRRHVGYAFMMCCLLFRTCGYECNNSSIMAFHVTHGPTDTDVSATDRIISKSMLEIMDMIDGYSPINQYNWGLVKLQDGTFLHKQSTDFVQNNPVWKQLQTTVTQCFKLGSFDGITFGTKLRHLYGIHGAKFGVLLIFSRSDHKRYKLWNISKPFEAITVSRYTALSIEYLSAIVFYDFRSHEDEYNELKWAPTDIDWDDISAIQPHDESMPDISTWMDDDMLMPDDSIEPITMGVPSQPPDPPMPQSSTLKPQTPLQTLPMSEPIPI